MKIFGIRFGPKEKKNPKDRNPVDLYREADIEYIVSEILDSTVDRDMLELILMDEIAPLVGQDQVNRIWLRLNELEQSHDSHKLPYWISMLRSFSNKMNS